MHVADIRGWGHLTGIGACALPEKEAIAIQEANSRLIAAAPDLLAACRAALEWCGMDGDHLHDPERAQLLAAIAKAEDI